MSEPIETQESGLDKLRLVTIGCALAAGGQAYSKGEGTGQSGTFTSPFPGYHGWYFMNLEVGPVQIELKVSGYYSEHKEMYRAIDGEVITNVDF